MAAEVLLALTQTHRSIPYSVIVNSWFDGDREAAETFRTALCADEAIVAGSAITAFLLNPSFQPHDVDIWSSRPFKQLEEFFDACPTMLRSRSEDYVEMSSSKCATTVVWFREYEWYGRIFQLIQVTAPTPLATILQFDLGCCQAWWMGQRRGDHCPISYNSAVFNPALRLACVTEPYLDGYIQYRTLGRIDKYRHMRNITLQHSLELKV